MCQLKKELLGIEKCCLDNRQGTCICVLQSITPDKLKALRVKMGIDQPEQKKETWSLIDGVAKRDKELGEEEVVDKKTLPTGPSKSLWRRCSDCGQEYTDKNNLGTCPNCNSGSYQEI